MNGLFVTDVDGTLLRTPAPVSAKVCAAAAQFRAAGGGISLCTGRAPASARAPAALIGANCPAILWGGAAIYDFQNRCCLWKRTLPTAAYGGIRRAVEEFPAVSVLVYTQEDIFILRRSPFAEAKGIPEEVLGPLANVEDICGEPIKVVLISEDEQQVRHCGQQCFGACCEVAPASRHFVEVVPPDAHKGQAVQVLSRLLGLERPQIFGAGDGMTDLPMLQQVGRAYAMSNSPEELRCCAHMVLPCVEDEGMVTAFLDAAATLTSS